MCCIPGRHVVRISPREDGGGGQCVKGPTKSNPTKKISPNLAHFSCHRAQFFSFFTLKFCIFFPIGATSLVPMLRVPLIHIGPIHGPSDPMTAVKTTKGHLDCPWALLG